MLHHERYSTLQHEPLHDFYFDRLLTMTLARGSAAPGEVDLPVEVWEFLFAEFDNEQLSMLPEEIACAPGLKLILTPAQLVAMVSTAVRRLSSEAPHLLDQALAEAGVNGGANGAAST